tara:strand:+ start:286 stop:822 length:537 start_codon:yes stop_codon:yes gene_type:complete
MSQRIEGRGLSMTHAELQQELERIEGRLFWAQEGRNRVGSGYGLTLLYRKIVLGQDSVRGPEKPRRPWSCREGDYRWNLAVAFWPWVVLYGLLMVCILWWAWGLIAYERTVDVSIDTVWLTLVCLVAIAGFTKFIFTAPEIRPSKLRYFHYTPAEQRPAMREQLEAERAVLLEQLAGL